MIEVHAAIEMKSGETPHGTMHRFMQAAVRHKELFSKLEVLDVFTVGTRKFVRFKVNHPKVEQILEDIRKDRAVILPNGHGYKAHLPGGRSAPVSIVKMHMAPHPRHKRVYRGPKHELWEAQF